jgi:hypothetical protein
MMGKSAGKNRETIFSGEDFPNKTNPLNPNHSQDGLLQGVPGTS